MSEKVNSIWFLEDGDGDIFGRTAFIRGQTSESFIDPEGFATEARALAEDYPAGAGEPVEFVRKDAALVANVAETRDGKPVGAVPDEGQQVFCVLKDGPAFGGEYADGWVCFSAHIDVMWDSIATWFAVPAP